MAMRLTDLPRKALHFKHEVPGHVSFDRRENPPPPCELRAPVATFDLSSNANELWPMVGMPGRSGGVRDNSGRVPGVLHKIIKYFRRMCRDKFSEPAT
jgi:hypothetical protein